ncbi:MAG: hypothetical protein PHE21_02305 [Candidatus Dojkabacteria bacterium]|nr:hypothetical protein [Candidatus Dojkabacteria bacterium]
MTKKKKAFSEEIEKLGEILSGEMFLRKKEKEILKAKKEAIENQKNIRRKKIVKGMAKLQKDPISSNEEKEVIQNIKLFRWEAPDRYEFKFNTKGFIIIVVLSLLFILFLAILQHYLLMVSIISILFLVYVAGTTKPQIVKHTITARGIETGNKLYEWFMLREFFFTKKGDQLMLFVETNLRIPGVLIFLLNEKEKATLFVLLQDKLLYKDIRKQSRLDKMSYGTYIPLEEI